MPPLRPEALTWTALLGRWVEFAQASLAIPQDAHGERWRRSVPAVINLQAVTFALAELGGLPADERAVALDKAQVLIDRSALQLSRAWTGEPMSSALEEITSDARLALQAAERAHGASE